MKEFYIVHKEPNGNIQIATVEASGQSDAKKSFEKVWPEKKFIQFNKY